MKSFDPVTFEVMKNEFLSLVEEMASTIKRTARSSAAREGGDYSTYVLDRDGRQVARAGLPTWYVPNAMPWVLEHYGDTFRRGDIVITNDPYTGGTHLPDLSLIMPVFWQEELIGFVGNVIHHGDIGGRVAGGMSPSSQSLYEEGLVLPRVLLHEGGRPNRAVYDIIRANVRAPDDVLGDIEGQVSGCWAAERGLMRLAERHGVATFKDYSGHLIHYTERLMREAIASIPDGVYPAETFIEDDGIGGPGVNIVLSVRVEGSSITLDFTGTGQQTRSAINVPTATVAANCMGNFHLLFGLHDLPSNAGVMAPFTFILPEGTVLNPRFPAAVGSRSTVTNRLEETFLKAIALAMPERVPASCAIYNIMIYTPDGKAGEQGELLFDLWAGSRGGRPMMDAADGPRPANSGRVGAEVIEQDHPVSLMGYGFVPDTGGAGRFRGGLALYRRWRFEEPGRLFNRNLRVTPVPGVAGGKAGQEPRVLFFSGDQVTDYSAEATIDIRVQPGDELLAVFPGPGGHGDPLDRDFAKINEDLFQEKLSVDFAELEYSVCIDRVSLKVDEARTAELRRTLRGSASNAGATPAFAT